MIVATAGHVDHGKTSLVEMLTGIQTDQLQEEKDRGLTIDLGFAYSKIGGLSIGFVDVPGHIKFINNMLAGIGAVDLALLVVAADDGMMPQTLEHLAILEALRVPALLVALTKIDRVEPARCLEVEAAIGQQLQGTAFEKSQVIPCSSVNRTGENELITALKDHAQRMQQRSDSGHFRMAIDRTFSIKGAGTVVTGAILAGEIGLSGTLSAPNQSQSFKVRGLHRQNVVSASASAGDRAALNLTGQQAALSDLTRGDWLTANPTMSAQRHCDIMLQVLPAEKKSIRHWTSVHVHHAAQHTLGHLATLSGPEIKSGTSGIVQLVSSAPLSLCYGDRLIFRDQGATRTIASGFVLNPLAQSRGRAKPERISLLTTLSEATSDADYLYRLVMGSSHGVAVNTIERILNWKPERIAAFMADHSTLIDLNGVLVSCEDFSDAKGQLVRALEDWHQTNPSIQGLDYPKLLAMLPKICLYRDSVIAQLKIEGGILQSGSLFHRPGAQATLPEQTQRLLKQVIPLLSENPKQPPVLHDLAAKLNVDPKQLNQHLMACTKAGLLVHPVKNRFFEPTTIADLIGLTQSVASGSPFTVQQYRDASGMGRNLCIELLEYFDQKGLTRRDGNLRHPRAN
ncbi:selenocysteine-specific translation elongation factor [Pseudomonadales bacterium]|nr:selenocysteine-specific translation elongation factor [Pseudomonadales bacterium]